MASQVYHESIFDLLDQCRRLQAIGPRPTLPIKEDAQGRIFVVGLTQVPMHGQLPGLTAWTCWQAGGVAGRCKTRTAVDAFRAGTLSRIAGLQARP